MKNLFDDQLIEYYKGKSGEEIIKADGLLFATAKNNFDKGRLSALKEIEKFIIQNKKKETLFILNETLRRIQKEIKKC